MKIDFAKRRRVMERSQGLGHCICDARRACPCDLLRERNLCPCAGERAEPVELAQVKLTQLTRNAGCASKMAPADLDAVLARLPSVEDSAVISGLAAADDAAIYRISDELCLVQTVDVFTPCVDSPHLFGKICAANCLSDIYAMGGEPRTALSVLAFPSETLSSEIFYQMLPHRVADGNNALAPAGKYLSRKARFKKTVAGRNKRSLGKLTGKKRRDLGHPRLGVDNMGIFLAHQTA